jgi:hypothetical protein
LVDWTGVIEVVPIVGLITAVLLLGARRDRFNLAVAVVVAIVSLLLVLDLIALSTDFHDAGGAFDCWPSCTTWHQLVGDIVLFGTALIVALVLLALTRSALRRSRGSLR